MRKIKFRAWHPDLKEMLYPTPEHMSANNAVDKNGETVEICIKASMVVPGDMDKVVPFPAQMTWDGLCYVRGQHQNLVWMQYTGIYDMDGVEICEGDIVTVYDESNKFVVKFGKVNRRMLAQYTNEIVLVELNTFYFENMEDGKPCFSIIGNKFGENDLDKTKIVGNIYEKKQKTENG